MALVYVQTIYAEDLGFRVQYTSLIPTSEPTETVPESEGPYNSDTHTIIDVYDDPSQGGGGGGDPVTIPYTGALQQVISGPGFTVLGSMTFDPSEFSTPEVMFTYTAMLTVPEGEVDARGRIRLYDMGDPESPEEVNYVVSSTLVNDDAGEIVYRTFDLVPGDDIASGLRLYEVRAEIRDYVEGCYLTIENASITSKGSASGGGGGGGGGGAPVDAPYLVFEPADGLPNAMGLAPSRSVQMMPIPGEVFFLQLDGDEDEPAPYSVYGTDGSGARGWFPSAGGGPVAAEDVTYDDELEAPELGTSTVQGAIDILKASSGEARAALNALLARGGLDEGVAVYNANGPMNPDTREHYASGGYTLTLPNPSGDLEWWFTLGTSATATLDATPNTIDGGSSVAIVGNSSGPTLVKLVYVDADSNWQVHILTSRARLEDVKADLEAAIAAAVTGLDWKASVRVATTANITLSGAQTIDGVSVIAGNRVLVKDQSTASQNGIYVCAAGAWSRATDADADAEVTTGLTTYVAEGTANGGKGYTLTTADPIVVGSTSLVFQQTSAAPLAATLPFIWRPGGVASGNVYTTWSSLYAAVNAAPVGARNVIVDTSLSSATVVDEATQTCGNWSIKGWGAGATITLTNSTLWMGNASGFIELEDISIVQDTSQTTVNVFNGDVVALKATRCNFHVGANTAGFMAFGTTSSALRMVFTDCSFSSNFGNIVFMNRNVACTYDATFYGRTMMNEDSLLYTDLGTTTTFNIQSSDTAFRNAQTWLTGSLVVTTSAAAPRRNPSATAAPSGSDNFAAGWAYGSQWIDTVGQDVYFCVGDGVWVQVN